MTKMLLRLACLVAIPTALFAQQPAEKQDTSPHKVLFITVEPNVKLEVLDWGGDGRPLVFLAGLGGTAHDFDDFAPKFTPKFHVYGITRRSFGSSSAPEPTENNYSTDRLGDDILAVMTALKLTRPVLIGHSYAGAEMSSIGSRYPNRIAGLIYLDAGYSYALYSPAVGDPIIDARELRHQLGLFYAAKIQSPEEFAEMEAATARFDRDIKNLLKRFALTPARTPVPANPPAPPAIPLAIMNGRQKYTAIHVPVLAIFADPHDIGSSYKDNPAIRAAIIANDQETTSAQIDAFQAEIPQARVVRIPYADHFIYRSNEAEVLHEMNSFLARLPQ